MWVVDEKLIINELGPTKLTYKERQWCGEKIHHVQSSRPLWHVLSLIITNELSWIVHRSSNNTMSNMVEGNQHGVLYVQSLWNIFGHYNLLSFYLLSSSIGISPAAISGVVIISPCEMNSCTHPSTGMLLARINCMDCSQLRIEFNSNSCCS